MWLTLHALHTYTEDAWVDLSLRPFPPDGWASALGRVASGNLWYEAGPENLIFRQKDLTLASILQSMPVLYCDDNLRAIVCLVTYVGGS